MDRTEYDKPADVVEFLDAALRWALRILFIAALVGAAVYFGSGS